MQISSIRNNILDRNIYYDMTGKEMKHGDIIGAIYSNQMLFGIIEYTTFNIISITGNKIENTNNLCYGLMFHIYKKCSESSRLLESLPSSKIEKGTNSCYSDFFHCDAIFDNAFSNNRPIIQAIKFNLSNIKERFTSEDTKLFANVQNKILNAESKIYQHYNTSCI